MNTTKTSKLFMAFAKGTESSEGNEIKRYTGVGSSFVLAVNPTKEELEKIYDRTLDNEINYIGEIDVNGEKVKNVRIDFIVKTDETHCNGIALLTKAAYFIRNEYRYNRDKSKVQVIDRYGRTAWVTIEQAKNHEIPMYKNGPANLDPDYRPCYTGEEELTKFIIAYLNIPSVMRYVNNKWVMVDHPEECEARLENIKNYFTGDFSELKAILKLQPKNKVKILYGVRTADNGNQYQATYTHMVLKNGVSSYTGLEKDLKERKEAGALSTTEFVVGDLMEYKVEATEFKTPVSSTNDPFGSEDKDDLPW